MSSVQSPVHAVHARALESLLGDWRTAAPAYRALADRIRMLVLDGRLVVGTRLPAERELAQAVGHSRTTVVAAYAALREQGLLRSVRGSGSVLAMPARGLEDPDPQSGTPIADLTKATPSAWPGLAAAAQRAVAVLPDFYGASPIDFYGLPVLRERIARRFVERGVATRAEQVQVTIGAQHAMTLVAKTLLARGDRVAIDVPTYPHAIGAFRDAGARLVPVALAEDGWDIDAWEDAVLRTRPTLAYVIPDFHNPTGASMPDDGRRRLLSAAARSGTVLVIDETTAELDIDRAAVTTPFAALARGTGATVVTLGSVGKTIWGGLRIGWIRTDEHLVHRFAAARPANDMGTPILEQLVVADLLPDMERIVLDRRAELGEARDAGAVRLRERLPSWRFDVPAGGLCFWVTLPAPVSTRLADAARSAGVHITAGPRFGVDGAFERHIRVPFTSPAPQLIAAIDLLADVWDRFDGVAPVPGPAVEFMV